ncbi:MAG: YbhB/YbcL family Raf kinase inhibitor-like protein [Rhizomicrobium sp.]
MERRWIAGLAFGVAAITAPASAMELTSPDVAPGAALALPQVYSQCGGGNVAPALSWSGAPVATKSFAVTLFDPDAAGGWWHWIVYDIGARVHRLARGAMPLPDGAQQGENDFGAMAYGGACPPPGSGVHHYRFTVWALDTPALPFDDPPKGVTIGPYLEAHALARATLTATYER